MHRYTIYTVLTLRINKLNARVLNRYLVIFLLNNLLPSKEISIIFHMGYFRNIDFNKINLFYKPVKINY